MEEKPKTMDNNRPNKKILITLPRRQASSYVRVNREMLANLAPTGTVNNATVKRLERKAAGLQQQGKVTRALHNHLQELQTEPKAQEQSKMSKDLEKEALNERLSRLHRQTQQPSAAHQQYISRAYNKAQRPGKVTQTLNEHLASLHRPQAKQPKDLEVLELRNETVKLKKTISQCRLRLKQYQRTIITMYDGMQGVLRMLDSVASETSEMKPVNVMPVNVVPAERHTPDLPLQTWEDLKNIELSLSEPIRFSNSLGAIRKYTKFVVFKRMGGAMTAVLDATLSPHLQEYLRKRSAPFNNPNLYKNYVKLFTIAASKMCTSQSVTEQEIRAFLSSLFFKSAPQKAYKMVTANTEPEFENSDEEMMGEEEEDEGNPDHAEFEDWLNREHIREQEEMCNEMYYDNDDDEEVTDEIIPLVPKQEPEEIDLIEPKEEMLGIDLVKPKEEMVEVDSIKMEEELML